MVHTIPHQKLAPIDRLPEHILSDIFSLAYTSCRYPIDDGVLCDALRVSSYWRRIALSTHSLWTTLDLQYPPASERLDRPRLENFLTRSGIGCTLKLSLCSHFRRQLQLSFFEVIMSTAPRCQELKVKVRCDSVDIWQYIRAASQVELLDIYYYDNYIYTDSSPTIQPASPVLPNPFLLNQLTTLSLGGIRTVEFPNLSILCPQLETLTLDNCRITSLWWSELNSTATSLRGVNLLLISWIDGAEDVPYPLAHLQLSNSKGLISHEVDILRNCSKLERLCLDYPYAATPPISCSYTLLNTLSLLLYYAMKIDGEAVDWQQLLHLLPVLQFLRLSDSIDRVSQSIPPIVNDILTALCLPSHTPTVPVWSV